MKTANIYILIFISLLMIISSGVYYLFSLSWLPWLLALIISLILGGLIIKKGWIKIPVEKPDKGQGKYFLPFFICLAAFFIVLITSSTSQALISPWQATPTILWPLFILIIISLIWAGKKSNGQGLSADIALSLFYLAFLSVAALVYKIGYGFDPFIHEASLRYIESHGAIFPKTPYYLGQYGLMITLDRLLPLSLSLINRFLLPFLSALLLIPALRTLLAHWKIKDDNAFLVILAILPAFAFLFWVTTPQNLAFLFLLLSVIYALTQHQYLSWLIALATLSLHPISGLPALLSVLFITLANHKQSQSLKQWLLPLGLFMLPLILIIAFLVSGAHWQWLGFSGISSLFIFLWPFPNQEGALLNLIYFFLHNIWFIGLIGIIWGVKQARKDQAWGLKPVILSALASILAAIFTLLFISFDSLISYEQQDYARRLLLGAWLISLPLVIYALADIAGRIKIIRPPVFIIAFTCLLAIALYGSYPRFDNYRNSRGYSLSQSDLEAVHIAEDMAQGESYIALANQQSSVGALKEFGFDRYLQNNGQQLYFYSIPTGGQLYQYYLSMVYQSPSRETMKEAMDMANVDTAFLLVSKYWWASDKVIAEAKLVANQYRQTSDGEITIFEFIRNQ